MRPKALRQTTSSEGRRPSCPDEALQQFASYSLKSCEGARADSDRHRARGHRHQAALRALAAKWVKILFVLWRRHIAYDENHHLAMMTRQRLRQAA